MALRFQRLTRPAIRSLNFGERINEHGICAARHRNGDVCYSVNVMVDGLRIHRVVGRESEGVTRTQAERAIEVFRTKAREGRLDLPSGRKTHRSFSEACTEYLARIEHHQRHGRNLSRKIQHVNARLVPYFKGQRLGELTDLAIADYIQHRKNHGAAQATINRELSTLSHLLGCCVEWGWLKNRPKIHKGEETRKQIVILHGNDKRALMKAALVDQDPLTWMFVAIAMATGMRHSEILRIRWSEIDFVQLRIYVPRAKAGQREQPMPTALATKLAEQCKVLGTPSGYLFPPTRSHSHGEHRQSMSQQFRRTVKRANLNATKITPHILRHTAITELVIAGVDLPTIQKISGHKTLAMVMRYTQISDEHIDRSVAVLDNIFAPSSEECRAAV